MIRVSYLYGLSCLWFSSLAKIKCVLLGLIYAVNGHDALHPNTALKGCVVNPDTGAVVEHWQPKEQVFCDLQILSFRDGPIVKFHLSAKFESQCTYGLVNCSPN